ncbi:MULTISPECIES: major capsid protein [unclassified Streptomyces]|uniref:major capsid protein n=1 Tax=unclassified Streptomyces TaxID=2593676 RepID=UPI002E184405|nr:MULTISPECIES: major capsid protein [unclassified Streptomyces]
MTIQDLIKDSGRYVNTAKYRAYDASVPFASREAWSNVREGALPPLGQKLLVGEQEQLLLEASHGADMDRLLELLYDNVERHVEAIKSRLELAAADTLLDGKLPVSENGYVAEVDFNVPAGNMPTDAVPWSDPTADPIRGRAGVDPVPRRPRCARASHGAEEQSAAVLAIADYKKDLGLVS